MTMLEKKSISCSLSSLRRTRLWRLRPCWISCHHWFCCCTLTVRKQWNNSQLPRLSSNLSTLLGEIRQSSIWFLTHYFSGSCCKITSIVRQIIGLCDCAVLFLPAVLCHSRQAFPLADFVSFSQGDAGSSAAGIKVRSKDWNSVTCVTTGLYSGATYLT